MLERGERVPQTATIELLAEALALTPAERVTLQTTVQGRLRVPSTMSRSRGVLSPIVGRVLELTLLERHLAGEGPPVLLLAGEPGIGKSRLLLETVQMAQTGGFCVLEGGCHQSGGQEPYAPLLGALERRIHHQPLGQLHIDLEGCSWLVRLLPELAEASLVPVPRWELSPPQERRLMFAAVRRFLTNVTGPSGTLLVLDDLQWADADALDLLATLIRSASDAPLRVVGAYRSTEVQPQDPLGIMQNESTLEGLAIQHELAPLRSQEAMALLGSLMNTAEGEAVVVAERMLRRAGGVPFFLVSLAQGLRTDVLDGDAVEDVPADVAGSIRQRVAALPDAAQELLGVAAVVGRVVPGNLLAATIALPEGEVIASLESVCQARLLLEDGEESYRFAHDLIREVVETDLSAARRKMLHRRVAQALERGQGEPPVEQLAYHYAQSNQKQKAMGYLEQAADRATKQYAHAEAEAYYQRLIELAHMQGDRKREGEALEKLGVLLDVVGRMDEAQEMLERSIIIYRSAGEIEDLRRGLARLARVYRARGMPQEGLTWVRPFLTAEEGDPSPGLVMLHRGLATLYAGTGRYRAQLAAACSAAGIARTLRNDALVPDVEHMHSVALALLGRTEESLQVAEQAIPLAEAQGDLWNLCFLVDVIARAYPRKGMVEQSRDLAERALELAERTGAPGPTGLTLCFHGNVEFVLGAWGRARRDFEQASSIVRPLGVYWIAALPPFALGELSLAEGKWETASRSLEESLALAERSSDSETLRMVQAALAERDLLEGRPEAARARLDPHLDRPGQQEAGVTALLPLLAWAYLDLSNQAQAQAVVSQAIARAEEEPNRPTLVNALRVLALAAIQQDRWQEAEGALEQALAITRAMPYPYAEAKALYVSGLLHTQKGEPEQARERLEAALAIQKRLGERMYAEHVEQTLAAMEP
jgi:tetratricopeptide (TPR) repeat protein